MTAIANITLNSVVYYPSSRNGSTGFNWVDRTSPYPAGQGLVSFTGAVAKGQYVQRVGFKLTFPTVVSESDACGCVGDVANESACTIYVDVDTRQGLTALTDLVARIHDLVGSTVFANAVEKLEGVW